MIINNNYLKILLVILTLFFTGPPSPADASLKEKDPSKDSGFLASQKASQAGKFLLIYYFDTNTDSAFKTSFDKQSRELKNKADTIRIDVKNPDESWLVDKFKVYNAPLPLVLVVAPNGAVTGSFMQSLPEDKLKSTIVSPATQQCLLAVQQRKLVFVCLQGKTTQNNDVALSGVQQFAKDPKYGKFTEIVVVDPLDKNETQLLSQLNANLKSSTATTILLSPNGQTIGKWEGATSKSDILKSLMSMKRSCGDPKCKDPVCPVPPAKKSN